MLVSIAKHINIPITGIIHVGANDCAEHPDYVKETDKIIWVEGNPNIVESVKKEHPEFQIYHALITDKDDDILDLNISNNNSQSSSVLEFNLHKVGHPSITFIDKIRLPTITIDTLIQKNNIDTTNINAMVLDIQGVELRALKGATQLLKNIQIIYTEVNIDETYTGCDKLHDIDQFLYAHNFRRVYTHIWKNHTYGDAAYIRM